MHNSDKFRYLYPADNNPVFLNPIVLPDNSDLSFIESKLRSEDFLPNLKNRRPEMTKVFQTYMKMVFPYWKIWLTETFKFTPFSSMNSPKCLMNFYDARRQNAQWQLCCWDMKIISVEQSNVDKFLKKLRCYVCNQLFDRSFNLMRHMQNCFKTHITNIQQELINYQKLFLSFGRR